MWKKIKEFFKKAGGYIVAFVLGLVSMLFINRRGSSRAQHDIDELRKQLQQFTDLARESGRANRELSKQLEQATAKYNELRDRVGECEGDSIKLGLINEEIGREYDKLGEAIGQLRSFIETNGKGK